MNIEELMSIDIDNLAQKQYDGLKEHLKGVLNKIITLLDQDKLEEIEEMLVESPGGDCYGSDDHYINFSYKENCEEDMYWMLDDLRDLRKILDKK